jgi:hypothetical protein
MLGTGPRTNLSQQQLLDIRGWRRTDRHPSQHREHPVAAASLPAFT